MFFHQKDKQNISFHLNHLKGPWNKNKYKTCMFPKWVFPKIGVPQNGWFTMENPKIHDLGVPLFFRKHPNIQSPKKVAKSAWPGWVCLSLKFDLFFQEISNRTHGPRTPKPQYLIDLPTYLGVRWDSVPFNFRWNFWSPQNSLELTPPSPNPQTPPKWPQARYDSIQRNVPSHPKILGGGGGEETCSWFDGSKGCQVYLSIY